MDRPASQAKRDRSKRHEKTFDNVMATLVRSITSPPPNTPVHLVSDLEALLERLIDEGIVPANSILGRLVLERGGKVAGERRFFDELIRLSVGSPHVDALGRLQQERELIHEFIYNRLGIYRVNFFLSIYDDFTLCHAHPFLPSEDMIIGPRFHRAEGEKLQRQLWLTPISVRRESEQAVLAQLWNHSDLSVLRARHWLAHSVNLTPWERDLGSILFFSEGFYYFSAFERAYRFGLPPTAVARPRKPLARRESEIGRYLGLTRRDSTTRRWQAVAHWWEAAIYGEFAAQSSGQSEALSSLDRLLSGCVTRKESDKTNQASVNVSIDRIKDRIRMIPKLADSHPVSRFVAKHADPLATPPELLRILGRGGDWSAAEALGLLKTFLEQNCDWRETEASLAKRVRPVIDLDVFAARDFNALIFPLGLRPLKRDIQAEEDSPLGPELTGMVFISTQLDFLEDWNAHRSKLNQIRAIFTLLGNLNLEVALQTELLRSARIRHILSLVETFTSLWQRISPEEREKRVLQRKKSDVLVALRRELRNLQPRSARDRLEVIRKQIEADQEIPSRLLRDLAYYSETDPVEETKEVRLDSLAKSVWASHIEPDLETMATLTVKSDGAVRVRVEEEAAVHVFENLLLNAVEAIQGGAPSSEIEMEIKIQSFGGFLNIPYEREVVVSIADRAFKSPDSPEKWFEPGYSTKARGKNYGFGLASAWKIVARHRGRIWAERADGRTVVRFALPLIIPPNEVAERPEAELSEIGVI